MAIPQRLRKPIATLAGLCVAAGVLVAGMVFPFAAGAGLVSNDAGDAVNSTSAELIDSQPPMLTTVQDSAGQPLAYLYDQYRVPVRTEAISPAMKAAAVAIEDRRFYVHDGVDWQATIRALVANSASGDVVQGASTLSQQYVKNYRLYVAARSESERLKATAQTPARKLQEAQIALQLERSLNKDEILTRYLNIVFWGNNAYGVAAAARTYFNTTPDALTIPQAAMLAGMVRSTSAYDPIAKPQAALDRRNVVIRSMAEQGMITEAQANEALATPLGVVNPLQTLPNGCIGAGDAGFFCKYVVDYLKEAGFSVDQINRGGYTIKTTLDRKVLEQTNLALKAEVPPTQPHVANNMSVVQPGATKHRVLAMGSSRVFGLKAAEEQTSYGLPYEPVRLGVGSIYKIFTAATALKKGLGINDIIAVPPDGYASPIYKDGAGRPIPVRNAGSYADRMSLQDALASSPNTAFVKLEEFTGVPDVVDTAVQLGMRSLAEDPFIDPRTQRRTNKSIAQVTKDQALASFTLGVTDTSVLELANVGATLSSGGMWCPPSPIESITDANGRPVPVIEEPCSQVVDQGLANTMVIGLSKDDTSGTAARAASQFRWNRPMLGKTGTTQQHKSAGFVGAVPQMSAAVITFDNSRSPKPLCDGEGSPYACGGGNIYGGKTPAQTWFRAMTGILEGQPVVPLPPADPRYVNGGAQKPVPDVVGKSVNDARALLQRAGWQVTVKDTDSGEPKGTVVAQNPSGSALPGEAIVLQVSNGSGESDTSESAEPPAPDGGGGPPAQPPPGGGTPGGGTPGGGTPGGGGIPGVPGGGGAPGGGTPGG